MKADTRSMYEKYVVNIDLAQRLYACGYTYPTMFFWVANAQLDTLQLYQAGMEYIGPPHFKFSAPTAMELKEHYPNEVWITTKTRSLHRRKGLFYFTKFNSRHIVSLMLKSDDTDQIYEFHREEDTSEANACGEMYAYIFENHLNELHTN